MIPKIEPNSNSYFDTQMDDPPQDNQDTNPTPFPEQDTALFVTPPTLILISLNPAPKPP